MGPQHLHPMEQTPTGVLLFQWEECRCCGAHPQGFLSERMPEWRKKFKREWNVVRLSLQKDDMKKGLAGALREGGGPGSYCSNPVERYS